MNRKCAMCGEYIDEKEFYKYKKYRSSYCNECRRFYNRLFKRLQRAREKDKSNPIIKEK